MSRVRFITPLAGTLCTLTILLLVCGLHPTMRWGQKLLPLAAMAQPAQAPATAKGVTWSTSTTWRTGTDTYNWEGIESDLADMNRAGITWVRIGLTFGQPFSFYDQLVRMTSSHHITILFLVNKGSPETDLGTAAQQRATTTWLGQAVQRYKSFVTQWECHNEPNLSGSWNIKEDAPDPVYNASVARYVGYLQQCYSTIKEHEPMATVLLGGISSYTGERFLRQLATDRAERYFDGWAIHPYADNPAAVVDTLHRLEDAVSGNVRFRSKPLWVTEIGYQHQPEWSTPGYVGSEQQKAQYLTETMQKLRAAGVSTPIFWYTLHEDSPVNGFGLVRKDNSVPRGGQSLVGDTWKVQGTGTDIGGAWDQFHYVWRTLAGDGSVSARLLQQADTNAWAKAGVMLRQSTDAGAPYYGAYSTPRNGVIVDYRATQGGVARQVASTAGTAPLYLRVSRSRGIFTAYLSRDGVIWRPIADSRVSMALDNAILGGLAVTSHQTGVISAATFATVHTTAQTNQALTPYFLPTCPFQWNCADIGNPPSYGTVYLPAFYSYQNLP